MARRQESFPEVTEEELNHIRDVMRRNTYGLTPRKPRVIHYLAAIFGSSFISMAYTRSVLRKELLEKFPDGGFAKMFKERQNKRFSREPMQQLEEQKKEETQRNYSGNMDFDKAEVPAGLDDRFRPTIDGYQQNNKQEEIVEQPKKHVTYSELRKQNREQYEKNQWAEQRSPSSFDIQRKPYPPTLRETQPPTKEKRNKYGDIISDE